MTDVLAHGAQCGLSGPAWVAVVLLGVLHGVDPGMGWLFAGSYGLQERDRGAAASPSAHRPGARAVGGSGGDRSGGVLLDGEPAVAVGVVAVTLTGLGALLLRKRHFTWVGRG